MSSFGDSSTPISCGINETCDLCKDGKDGRDGREGRDGRAGRDGRDGKDGMPGRDGIQGRDGRDGTDGRDGKDGASGQCIVALPATGLEMACSSKPFPPKGECCDSWIDQTFKWMVGWINWAYNGTIWPILNSVGQQFTRIGSWLNENPLGWALKSIGSFLSYKPHDSTICFGQALRFSAETMGFLKPNELNLGKGLTWPRIWSWVQTLAGPFLFVMFSLALKNKLKRE